MRPVRSSLAAAAAAAAALAVAVSARAEVAEPAAHEDTAFDLMNLLAHRGLHDLNDESWNLYGQVTDIWSAKMPFHAKYTDFNGTPDSLSTSKELSFTETATFFAALRLWPGGEAYIVPEIIGERPLSHLTGLGGTIQNFELQKNGSTVPAPYISQVYLAQTIPLGGESFLNTSQPHQLGHPDTKRRIVVSVGNFSVLDFFDKNDTAGDLRRSFFNMSFLTYAAYDFAADARGYAWGGVTELYWDDWSARVGRVTPPKDPNQLALDFHLGTVYGDQAEVAHAHTLFGHEGAVRVLGYRNVENMGRFSDAIAAFRADPSKNATTCTGFNYGSANAGAPDLCWARKSNVKLGAGLSIEQEIVDDIVRVFFRGMYSDGRSEVYSYTSTDRSISFGSVIQGTPWHRAGDNIGLGWSQGWISKSHADYLGMGGIDGFIGDGKINQASEHVVEAYYRVALGSSAWFTADYQHIWNPAYNADRGPVDIFGGRIHAEF
jgi:hypothetical protein